MRGKPKLDLHESLKIAKYVDLKIYQMCFLGNIRHSWNIAVKRSMKYD